MQPASARIRRVTRAVVLLAVGTVSCGDKRGARAEPDVRTSDTTIAPPSGGPMCNCLPSDAGAARPSHAGACLKEEETAGCNTYYIPGGPLFPPELSHA